MAKKENHATALEPLKTRARLASQNRKSDLAAFDEKLSPMAYLVANFVLTKWKNSGGKVEDAIVPILLDEFYKFYGVSSRSGSRYSEMVGAIERLRKPVRLSIKSENRYREVDVAMLTNSGGWFWYRKRKTERMFRKTNAILQEFPALYQFGDPVKNLVRLVEVKNPKIATEFKERRPGSEPRIVQFEDGGFGFAIRHRNGSVNIFRPKRVPGDEHGIYKQDEEGNYAVDLAGKPERLQPEKMTVVLDPMFLTMLERGEINLIWFPAEFGKAMMAHKKDVPTFRLMYMLATYPPGRAFNWGLMALADHLGIGGKCPKSLKWRTNVSFQACVDAKIIAKMPTRKDKRGEPWATVYTLSTEDFLRHQAG